MSVVFPQDAIVEFLRRRITDPRSTIDGDNARTYTPTTETFSGDDTTKEFSLSPPTGSVSYIDSVVVDSETKKKWRDYYLDFKNQKIVFFDAPASGSYNISVTYYYGAKNWIYPDRPLTSLSLVSFPRISVLVVSGVGERLGQYNSDIESSIRFQIDIFTKEGGANEFELDGRNMEGEELGIYLGHQVIKAFRSYEDDLHPILYNYTLLSIPRSLGWNAEYQAFHIIVEVELNTINQGEV